MGRSRRPKGGRVAIGKAEIRNTIRAAIPTDVSDIRAPAVIDPIANPIQNQ